MHLNYSILVVLFYLASSNSEFNNSINKLENQIPIDGLSLNENAGTEEQQHLTPPSSTQQTTSPERYSCNRLKGLSAGQLKHCYIYEDHMGVVADGVRTSLKECQKHFKYHRWNCSLSPAHQTFFGPNFKIGTKEAAYVQAITSAGVMHAVARSCKDGQLTRCGCSTLARPRDLHKDWLWRGCGDNLEYAYKFTRNLIDVKEQEKIHKLKKNDKEYSRLLMTLHNNEAGRRAVLKQTKVTCKCHGVSGSCSLITCWHQLPIFTEIGDYITYKYRSAIKVRKNRKGRLQVRNANGKRSTVTDLVYVQQSPDFCEQNYTYGILGTENRECSLKLKEAGNCEELCCGRGYNARKIFVKEKCNCKFQWCCYVKCDNCVTPKEVITCK